MFKLTRLKIDKIKRKQRRIKRQIRKLQRKMAWCVAMGFFLS